MKIEFTKNKELVDLSRTVKVGDTLTSPADAPEELLRAYVDNGIAKICKEPGVKSETKDLTPDASPLTKGE